MVILPLLRGYFFTIINHYFFEKRMLFHRISEGRGIYGSELTCGDLLYILRWVSAIGRGA